jgi:nitrite reductase/ring-hydroxylating ferredoxin subunit
MNKNLIYFCEKNFVKNKFFIKKWMHEFNDEICGLYIDKKMYFYSSICPHFGGELEFLKKNNTLRCKWHGWRFEALTGKSISNLESYEQKSIFSKILSEKKKSIGCFPFNGILKKYDYSEINDKIFLRNDN